MNIIKKIIGLFTGLMTIAGLILILIEEDITFKIIFFIESLFFGFVTYKLIDIENKKSINSNDIVSFNAPDEILNDLKGTYDKYQTNNLVKIINESYKIMQSTKNIETLCERYDLAMQKIYTLKELEQTKEYFQKPNADYYISLFTSNYHMLIRKCHDRYLNEFKTKQAKKIKDKEFWSKLSNYVDEYTLKDIQEMN